MTLLAPGRNLVLVGMMGSGKSTVGRLVAQRLRRPFVDTDALVEQRAGRSITELFAEEGERGFREREAEAIRHVAALRGQVIAVGGGAVLDRANVTQLRATGDLLLLTARPDVLAARVGAAATRPLVGGADAPAARLAALAAERRSAYLQAAAGEVDTTAMAPKEVADAVLAWAAGRPGLLVAEERGR